MVAVDFLTKKSIEKPSIIKMFKPTFTVRLNQRAGHLH